MNELLTVNLKSSVEEAPSNFNLKAPKTHQKGENFSLQLKSQIAKRDVKRDDSKKDDTSLKEQEKAPVKKEEKTPIKKGEQNTKVKERREKSVSEKNKADNNDNNTDQLQALNGKNTRQEDDLNKGTFETALSSDDKDTTPTLDDFLEEYLNVSGGIYQDVFNQGAVNDGLTEDNKFAVTLEDHTNPAIDLMKDLSAFDMYEDLPDNLFENLTDDLLDVETNKVTDKQSDDLFNGMTNKLHDMQSDELLEGMTNKLPDMQSDDLLDGATNKLPDKQLGNLFEGMSNKLSDKQSEDSDKDQMDKLYQKPSSSLAEKVDIPAANNSKIEQINGRDKAGDSPIVEILKSVAAEQNSGLKTADKDDHSNKVDIKVDTVDVNFNNVSVKVSSGRDVPAMKGAPANSDAPRVFILNENKFIITKHGDNKVEVSLEPNGIGKLSIEINHEKGIIHTTISASEASGKEIIEKNINRIMDELVKEGINIGQFSVTLKERHDQLFDNPKGNTHSDLREIEELEQDISVPAGLRHSNGRLSIFI